MADLSNASCIQQSWDAVANKVNYTVTGPYVSGSCYDFVLMPASAFEPILSGAGGASGSGSNPFTTDEVTALKLQAATPSIFNLSPAEGSLIGGAILSVFAAAWAFRVLIRALNVDGDFER